MLEGSIACDVSSIEGELRTFWSLADDGTLLEVGYAWLWLVLFLKWFLLEDWLRLIGSSVETDHGCGLI